MEDLKERTKRFALSILRIVETVPRGMVSDVLCRQIIRSATSVGANYRAACRARSRADFISKICIVEEETDETMYWLELLKESGIVGNDLFHRLHREASELLAIFIASKLTARRNKLKTSR
ncbi:MAG: four helix bundle protein [bacterium]